MELGIAHRSQLPQNDQQFNIAELDDTDIDAIQEILDESDGEDDDAVTINSNAQFVWPLKPTRE